MSCTLNLMPKADLNPTMKLPIGSTMMLSYTLKGAILIIVNRVTVRVTTSAPTHSNPIRSTPKVLQHSLEQQRLQKQKPTSCAHSLAAVASMSKAKNVRAP
jgi:hypothetical protein